MAPSDEVPGSTLVVRFSVVSFAPPGSRLVAVGDGEELWNWTPDHARTMRCRLGDKRLQSEPDFHWVDITLAANTAQRQPPLEYKFVEVAVNGDNRWELEGKKNRRLSLDGLGDGKVLLLPVARFADGAAGESDHTGRFYQGVKERCEISVNKVFSQLFVGSCPRQRSHIDHLKSLGVTVVINFQTEEDCKKNAVAGIGMEEDCLAVSYEYERRALEYIWMPTFDMSTDGRAQMLPQASHLFVSLICRGHVIYSHCNAGVGRSVAAVCGCLLFGLGLSLRQMEHIVASARPVAYLDFPALERARPHYVALFGRPLDGAAVDACRSEALARLEA